MLKRFDSNFLLKNFEYSTLHGRNCTYASIGKCSMVSLSIHCNVKSEFANPFSFTISFRYDERDITGILILAYDTCKGARAREQRAHRERTIAQLNQLLWSLISICHNFIELIIRISRVSPTVHCSLNDITFTKMRNVSQIIMLIICICNVDAVLQVAYGDREGYSEKQINEKLDITTWCLKVRANCLNISNNKIISWNVHILHNTWDYDICIIYKENKWVHICNY